MMKVNFVSIILLLLVASTWAVPLDAKEQSLSQIVFYVG